MWLVYKFSLMEVKQHNVPDNLQIIFYTTKKVLDVRYSSIISSIIDFASTSQVSKKKKSVVVLIIHWFYLNIIYLFPILNSWNPWTQETHEHWEEV